MLVLTERKTPLPNEGWCLSIAEETCQATVIPKAPSPILVTLLGNHYRTQLVATFEGITADARQGVRKRQRASGCCNFQKAEFPMLVKNLVGITQNPIDYNQRRSLSGHPGTLFRISITRLFFRLGKISPLPALLYRTPSITR